MRRRPTDHSGGFQVWRMFWEGLRERGLGSIEIAELQAFVYGLVVCPDHPGQAVKNVMHGGACPCAGGAAAGDSALWRRYLDSAHAAGVERDDRVSGLSRDERLTRQGEVMAEMLDERLIVPPNQWS